MNLISRAKDANKDQTYFIWQIKSDQLDDILFPVGEFETKAEVRDYAQSKNLITSSKPDSQGLCFVGQTSLRDMLLQTLGHKPGFIYTHLTQVQIDQIGLKVTKKTRGQINAKSQYKIKLGEHDGAFLFTIGQRQNLGISNGPWFVADIDIENNEVIVCHNLFQESIQSSVLLVSDLNWHLDIDQDSIYTQSRQIATQSEKLELINDFKALNAIDLESFRIYKLRLKAQIRYRSEAKACYVFVFVPNEKMIKSGDLGVAVTRSSFAIVRFDQSVKAAAKGQSIVFYDYPTDQYLIGGGVIEQVLS